MATKIHFFNQDTPYRIRQKKEIARWLEQVIRQESLECDDISIILCSDEFLYQMNVKHLNHDTYTDIITFEYSEAGQIRGDIFVSIDRIKENAKAFKHRTTDELHRVIVHGVLHLCGYQDKSLKDKSLMRSKEDFYLSLRPF